MYKPFRKRIMIDLDGVLNTYTKYDENSIPEVRNGAKEFVEKISEQYDLVLFTTRNLKLAAKWLIENNLDPYFKDVTNVKLPAEIYLDDRAIQFNGNFEQTINDIENFKVFWK